MRAVARQAGDLRPALHEAVVRKRFLRALLALAHRVEPIGQLAGDLGLAAELGHKLGRRVLAAGLQRTHQMMNRFPRRQAWVGFRVPVRRQLVGTEETHFAALRCENARLDHARDTGVLGLGKRLRHTIFALIEARLLEPRERPAAVGVEVALLLGQRLVESLVDKRQCFAHRERFALGVEHFRVAGIDSHAGADGRLRQVHRRDIAALKMA